MTHPQDARPNSRWFRFATPAILVLTAALYFPGLRMGFFQDDYYWLDCLRGVPHVAHRPGDLTRFFTEVPEEGRALIARGPFPWWTDPNLRMGFFRPIFGALLHLDYALFGLDPVAFHLHSFAWFILMILTADLLFQRWLPGAPGKIALLVFVLHPSLAQHAGWISVRHATLSATFVFASLYHHWRWRGESWKPGMILSLLCYVLGLLSSETAVSFFAWSVLFELVVAREPWRRRAAALCPVAIATGAYLLFYQTMGYGSSGSSFYASPFDQPLRFLAAAFVRVPALFAALVLAFPSEIWSLIPDGWGIPAGLLSACLLVPWVVRFRGEFPGPAPAVLVWILLSASPALLPASVSLFSGRLVAIPWAGLSAVLAAILYAAWRKRSSIGLTRTAAFLAALHFVAAPVWARWLLGYMERFSRDAREAVLRTEVDDSKVARQRIVILRAPDALMGYYMAPMWSVLGRPRPLAWWLLSFAPSDHRLTRTGENTFELETVQGSFLQTPLAQLARSAPMREGEQVHLLGATVTVRKLFAGYPSRIEVRFAEPLDSGAYAFLTWKDRAFRQVALPPVGRSIRLRWEPGIIAISRPE